MHYYRVAVARGLGPNDEGILIYHAQTKLPEGALVAVPFGKREIAGVVWQATEKPAFATKAVARALPLPPLTAARRQFLSWLADYYAASLPSVVALSLPSSLAKLQVPPEATEPAGKAALSLPPLTADQARVTADIMGSAARTHFLHAETGAGKTRIYREQAEAALEAGHSVLILVPEIALSTQTHHQLMNMLEGPVELYHSGLAGAARRRLWCEALTGDQPRIWLGTRSALLLPIAKPGLIVIDECHDNSYKQASAPRYRATHAAAELSRLTGAKLILGSATPPVADIYVAGLKSAPIHRITEPIRPAAKTKLTVVDLRDKAPRRSASAPWLSQAMEDGIAAALSRNEQALIYLNRRGSAPLILCGHCGWQALCANCGLPQTYHGDHHRRRCHACNRSEPMPGSCPECGEPELLLKGCGTKEIERLLQVRFPHARLLRLDRDNFKAGQFGETYQALRRGEVDILIGTQMIAKGFDLPGVSFVGVVHADAPLSLPDFAAGERTFQLLYQVIGRGGRGGRYHEAVIQTYRPDHPAIAAGIKRDWQAFYRSELEARRSSGFPPFRFAAKITCRKPSDRAAEKALAGIVAELPPGVRSLGPGPAMHAKSGSSRIWNLILLSSSRRLLGGVARSLPSGCIADLDPTDLL
jgi:primosomal protein N' (replication factor Y)